ASGGGGTRSRRAAAPPRSSTARRLQPDGLGIPDDGPSPLESRCEAAAANPLVERFTVVREDDLSIQQAACSASPTAAQSSALRLRGYALGPRRPKTTGS